MKVSVIIPCYKTNDYLWQCLLSIKNQHFSHSEFELLIILNGEREPYYSAIKSFLETEFDDSFFVKLFYSDFANVSNARNIGIDNARGDYIAFIDDDDYVSESYLSSLYVVSSESIIGIAHPIAFNNDGVVPYSLERKYESIKMKSFIDYRQAITHFQGPCMKLIHRDIINDRRFNVDFKNGEDSLFMFQISDRFDQVCAAPEDVIYYRRIRNDSANYSRKSFLYYINNSLKLIVNYSIIFFRDPLGYSFSFYLTRVLGALKTCIFMR